MITFELEQSKEDMEKNDLAKDLFGTSIASKVIIRKDGNIVGHIFTPSSSSNNIENAVQVCGFTEAFDLWGCGIFKGYLDIQLLFDEGILGGIDNDANMRECLKCYRKPCQCENKDCGFNHPFNVKRQYELEKRIVRSKE